MVLFMTSPAICSTRQGSGGAGLEFCHSATPTGGAAADGSHAILAMNRAENVANFDRLAAGDGQAFDREMNRFGGNAGFVFGLLGGNLWSMRPQNWSRRKHGRAV